MSAIITAVKPIKKQPPADGSTMSSETDEDSTQHSVIDAETVTLLPLEKKEKKKIQLEKTPNINVELVARLSQRQRDSPDKTSEKKIMKEQQENSSKVSHENY